MRRWRCVLRRHYSTGGTNMVASTTVTDVMVIVTVVTRGSCPPSPNPPSKQQCSCDVCQAVRGMKG